MSPFVPRSVVAHVRAAVAAVRHMPTSGVVGPGIDGDERAAVEHWFTRRGVPHFIADYSARDDIWTRAIPVLVVAYLLGGLNALDITRSAAWNLLAATVVLAILGATWALANRARRRPLFSMPDELGVPELAAFLLGPILPPLVLGQWGDALQAFLEGLALLVAIYLATSYAVIPLLRWAWGRSLAQVALFFNTVVRVLPLLLLVITFLFVNAEVWQVAGRLDGVPYVIVVALFVAFGVLFVLSRVPALVASLSSFASWDEVDPLLASTPAAGLLDPAATLRSDLSRRERFNIGLVAVFSQALQITFVAVSVFGFFVLFGFLAIPADTTAAWTGEAPNVLAGDGLVVTEELLRVAGFLGAFTGMYFTVVLSTDATYREEFAEDVAPRIRQALAVRAVYRARWSASDPAPAGG